MNSSSHSTGAPAPAITRRAALLGALVASAALAVPVAAAAAKPVFVRVSSPSTHVPVDAWAAVQNWAASHRAATAAQLAYSNFLRPISIRRQNGGVPITPSERVESDRLFAASIQAAELVGPARENMLIALLNATEVRS